MRAEAWDLEGGFHFECQPAAVNKVNQTRMHRKARASSSKAGRFEADGIIANDTWPFSILQFSFSKGCRKRLAVGRGAFQHPVNCC